MPYVVEGDALHGQEVLLGVHLVQVAVGDEHGAVLHLVEMVDLVKTKQLISPACTCTPTRTHIQGHFCMCVCVCAFKCGRRATDARHHVSVW